MNITRNGPKITFAHATIAYSHVSDALLRPPLRLTRNLQMIMSRNGTCRRLRTKRSPHVHIQWPGVISWMLNQELEIYLSRTNASLTIILRRMPIPYPVCNRCCYSAGVRIVYRLYFITRLTRICLEVCTGKFSITLWNCWAVELLSSSGIFSFFGYVRLSFQQELLHTCTIQEVMIVKLINTVGNITCQKFKMK